jgi:hypothetical protein
VAVALLDINRAYSLAAARDAMSEEDLHVFQRMRGRLLQTESEMGRFRALADRYDNLYYPNGFTSGGASHWADHPSAQLPGRAHVSVNAYPVYVDVPAALQSVPPIENFVTDDDTERREKATLAERVYRTWLETEQVNVKSHKACTVKGLYGRTAGKVFWDDALGRPSLSIVEQPRNLRLGWASSDYTKPSWALYVYRISPETAEEDWGLQVEVARDSKTGEFYPYVLDGADTYSSRSWLAQPAEMAMEVYDYWYRLPVEGATHELGKPVEYETWNAIFIGNALVSRKRHPEYKGSLPYVPLFNTYIPGVPDGRSEFYDIEQLIREKDERMSEAAQMMSRAVNGQMWQLVGAEAPDVVPPHIRPVPNVVVGPGAGNRIEKIEPWMPTFQIEQHLARLDRDLADVSGLNDLLRGLAPSAVLSSSKAISALVANYETRISIKREMLYEWRRSIRELAFTIWSEKNRELKPILQSGFRHDIVSPSLTPRDDAEAAMMAANLLSARLWSQRRAMDRVGVDDPEAEQELIREERTDATLFPADVQTQAALLATLTQTRLQQEQAQQGPVQPSPEEQQLRSRAALMAQEGGRSASPMMQAPEEQPVVGGEPGPGMMAEGGGPPAALPSQMLAQFQVQEGETKSRIVGQSTIQKTEG